MIALSVVNWSRSVGAVRGPDYPFSATLLAIRERIWDESRTDVSVNAGEFVGAVRFLTGGVLTCAHNSVSAVHEPHC